MWRVLRTLLQALGAAVVTSVVLAVVSAQFAPGWRPAAQLAPLSPAPDRLPEPSAEYEVAERETRVHTDDGTRLAARVVLPVGVAGPVAGAVLVQGSGLAGLESLLEEARTLAAAGVAAIVVDKRADGYSMLSRDFDTLAADVALAADLLAAQPGVDPDRIGAIGWSEGGWVVPLAADREPGRFAYLVLVSAPIVTPLEQASWTIGHVTGAAPAPLARIPATMLSAGPEFVDYVDTDIRGTLAEVEVPVYAVWGAADPTVPVRVALDRLRESAASPITARILAGEPHSFGPEVGLWMAGVADWIVRLPASAPAADSVSGAEPESDRGLEQLPRRAWFTHPLVHGVLALAVAALVGRRAWRGPTARRDRPRVP
ncbi:alpha/beta hydrolase family protein [Occultella gossypii]|uniref:Prolyl oligopeptidase family serine peptidase n=1 Tax=Occultella gossypii TaxID=2800820 RepID=A0ABS7SJ55_9MICO|nr:prolyl oligopeptidase family serine peptidase [Occultella gossypii]MBZ2199313.1 prolyl oligopeptidase family serine peptidase [Occultella gossypii]